MKFQNLFLLLCCFQLSHTMHANAIDPGQQTFSTAPQQRSELKPAKLVALPFETRGGFVGKSGGSLIVAAAPSKSGDAPLSIWAAPLDKPDAPWTKTTVEIPRWAASAQWGDSVICAGGMLEGKPVARVLVITTKSGTTGAKELPPLPKPLAGAGAAVIGNTLYLYGGASSLKPEVLENALWTLDLAKPGAAWKAGPASPAAPRAFFSATGQYGMLCIFGGITARGASREAWVYQPVPLEGMSDSGWKQLPDMPESAVHSAIVPIGQASVMLIGGERNGTLDGESDSGATNAGRPLLIHLLTQAWVGFDRAIESSAPLAVSNGATVLTLGGMARDGSASTLVQEISFPRTVRSLSLFDYLVIALYFVAMAWIGISFAKRQKSSEEFSLGNRKVVWWAAGISMFATAASAISLMAVPALAFATNLIWLLPVSMVVPGYFITGYFMYPMLRRMDLTSTYEYLDRRFNRPLRLLASAQCILFQVFGRAAVVLVLPSIAISAITGINVYASVFVMGVLTTVYTSLGGFEAVIWTAVFQGVLKFLTPIFVIVVALMALPGGWHEFVHVGTQFDKFRFALTGWDISVPVFWVLLLNAIMAFTVQQAGDQPIIQRVFSSPLRDVRRVNLTMAVCSILIAITTTLMGLTIFAYFHAHPEKFDPSAQNDQIVPLFLTQAMPSGFAGLVIAAIFAAAMATVGTSMNSVATLFMEDFYLRFRPNCDDKHRLRVLKIASYTAGFISTITALLLAGAGVKSMMAVWSQIMALLGGGIVGVYSLGMFTRRANGAGAVSGVIISIFVTAYIKLFTTVHWQAYLPIAILSCMASGYLISLFSKQNRDLEGLTVFTPKKQPGETAESRLETHEVRPV